MNKEELNELHLDTVAGGAGGIDQSSNGNKKAVQQNNANGKNAIKIVQYNTVEKNKGNVKIGPTVTIENPQGPISFN
ncbi:MAG: hypothetical protein K6F95_08885 [Selenomonas sp.]|uniref:hypothetical protein n=1 Tax=Selenomonas sp. TaxID=2053611 RepID=UPI0025FF34F3|nr:hypothetical protein [Selenomonas sp.]MCR5758006.1 hypothetical protein [Selenomonas sp.]